MPLDMSESEQDTSVLGKRARNGEDSEMKPAEGAVDAAVDDSDDDVGPMPAEAAGNGGAKKKRKGACSTLPAVFAVNTNHAVLPHEKLYLEHLPSADRYFKSFMHRDVIIFVVMTRCILLPSSSVNSC